MLPTEVKDAMRAAADEDATIGMQALVFQSLKLGEE